MKFWPAYPRGTKLEPSLFLVMIDNLEINSSNGNANFVDDTTSFEIVEKYGQSTAQVIVDEISDWTKYLASLLHVLEYYF
jgi:hypothetical protein